jgi:DNA-binding transcriptional LysR family regulator
MARDGIDIAIRTGEPHSDTFVVRRIGQLTRRLYASPNYIKQRGIPLSVDELRHHALIANSQHEHLNVWQFKNSTPIHAEGPFSADNTATVASMCIAGLGVARITSVVATPLVLQGKLVAILPEEVDEAPIPLSAFMLAGRHRLPKIRACIDHWAQWLHNTSPTC